MMISAVTCSEYPPTTVKGAVLVTSEWSGFDATTTMAAVPWFTPVTSPIGVVGLRVAQDEPVATVPPGHEVQTPPLELPGHKEIVQDFATRPVGQVVVTVATDVLLELQLVVMAGLLLVQLVGPARPAVTSCVMGVAEKVPMASSWLDCPGDATD